MTTTTTGPGARTAADTATEAELAAALDGATDPDELFWCQRSDLTRIRDYARAHRVGPWAMLGVILARATAAIPPSVRLPATIGGHASLNLFTGLVGPSGAGKGAAEAAAYDAVRIIGEVQPDTYPIGSGEGLARTFRPHGTDDDAPNPVTSAIFTAGEVDTLTALGGRSGSTLMPQLRHLFMGETIGFGNAGKETRVIVQRHTYRACLLIGIQPMKSAALLGDADGGTPQRVLWMPVADIHAPDTPPGSPDPLEVRIPRPPAVMSLPDTATAAMDAHRVETLRGGNVDPLDGHALLTRAKVAAALALLHERVKVTENDWTLSGDVMRVSTETREGCRNAIAETKRKANRARAHADAERAEIIAEHAGARMDRRAREAIVRYLQRHGESSRAPLRRSLKMELRGHFDTALEDLTAQGAVTEGGGGYRLT